MKSGGAERVFGDAPSARCQPGDAADGGERSFRNNGRNFDLDPSRARRQPNHLNESARRANAPESLAVGSRYLIPGRQIGDVDDRARDVPHLSPCLRQSRFDKAKSRLRLFVNAPFKVSAPRRCARDIT